MHDDTNGAAARPSPLAGSLDAALSIINWRYEYQPGGKYEFVITLPHGPREPNHHGVMDIPCALGCALAREGGAVMRAYYTLAAWSGNGEEISLDRYLREVRGSTDPDGAWPVEALRAMGLVITPEQAEERRQDYAQVHGWSWWSPGTAGESDQARHRKPQRKVEVRVPNPFQPLPLGEPGQQERHRVHRHLLPVSGRVSRTVNREPTTGSKGRPLANTHNPHAADIAGLRACNWTSKKRGLTTNPSPALSGACQSPTLPPLNHRSSEPSRKLRWNPSTVSGPGSLAAST